MKKKSLVGWTEKGWYMKWDNKFCPLDTRPGWEMELAWHSLDISEITKQIKAYTNRKNPVKVRITIEEVNP